MQSHVKQLSKPINDNARLSDRMASRIEELVRAIACHQQNIQTMLRYAPFVKCPTELRKLACEIGESRIEIECVLRPELERLQACQTF